MAEANLENTVLGRISNREELFIILQKIPCRLWESLFKPMNIAYLTKHMTRGQNEFNKTVMQKSVSDVYKLDETANRAILYCLFQNYKLKRSGEPNFYSRSSAMFAKLNLVSENDGHSKIEACNAVLNFLVSGRPLKEFRRELDDPQSELHKYKPALTEQHYMTGKSFLCELVEQIDQAVLVQSIPIVNASNETQTFRYRG